MVRGATPTTTKLMTVIDAAVTVPASQRCCQRAVASTATRVVAVSSQASRSNSSRFRWRTTSTVAACRALAPRTPSRGSSAARAVGDAALVHREREHVGRPVRAHPTVVELGHVLGVDEEYGQLGERVHAHLVEGVPGDGQDRVGVDLGTRLVGDFDGHAYLLRP